MTTERMLGGLYEGKEYMAAMEAARAEFVAWEQKKRKNRKETKDTFRAKRLAKLDMEKLGVLF
jgi:hypothetical protein